MLNCMSFCRKYLFPTNKLCEAITQKWHGIENPVFSLMMTSQNWPVRRCSFKMLSILLSAVSISVNMSVLLEAFCLFRVLKTFCFDDPMKRWDVSKLSKPSCYCQECMSRFSFILISHKGGGYIFQIKAGNAKINGSITTQRYQRWWACKQIDMTYEKSIHQQFKMFEGIIGVR